MDFLNVYETIKTAIRIAMSIAHNKGNGTYSLVHLLSPF
jgi:hypothetical protein